MIMLITASMGDNIICEREINTVYTLRTVRRLECTWKSKNDTKIGGLEATLDGKSKDARSGGDFKKGGNTARMEKMLT